MRRLRSTATLQIESLERRRPLTVVPAGFTETVLADGLTSPTTLDIAPDGRVWVAYQDGRIEVIEPGAAAPRLAIQLDCDGSAEHGLQGLELDPHFESNHFIYVYYTAASPLPHNRLSRLTVDPTTENSILPGSEVPLLELPNLADYGNPPWHIGGAVHVGLDGTLFVQIGESQQSAQSPDLDSPLGKILHLNPDGTPAANNPYLDANNGISWRDYVWSSGLRNPFAGDLDPVTGRYFVCDVGAGRWEEINDATLPGLNFGWPATEGGFDQQAFPDFTQPFHAYSHSLGCAITGGAFNNGGSTPFPSATEGMFFFSEFCGGEIRMIDPDNPSDVSTFITNAAFPMNLEFGTDGALYYIARGAGAGGAPGIGTGSVRKVAYVSNQAPVIVTSPGDRLVSVGYPAIFQAAASGTAPLEYQWQASTDGTFHDIPDATGETLTVTAPTLSDSGTQYRAVVTNGLGSAVSAAATLIVTADTPPTPTISLPAEAMTYRAGDTIAFSGRATDLEDGTLAAAQLTWRITFHHNVHSHPFIPPTSGLTGGEFTIPIVTETDADVFYRITLTAVDSAGLVSEISRDIIPQTSTFSVLTNLPAGSGSLFIDNHSEAAPFTTVGVENVERSLEAARILATGNASVVFTQWLDGETERVRTVNTPAEDTAYVALYSTIAGAGVYLSDLTPVGTPINGWGPIEFDQSNGEQAAGDGKPITLNGVVYDKGLGVHANSEVVYALGGQFGRFQAAVGVDDENAPDGTVVFRVLVDGVERFSSGRMTNASATQLVNVDVAGAEELRLIVETAGDGNGSDHADWADARLVAASTPLVDVNFQLAGTDVPAAYFPDTGLVFADRGNGWEYGWSSDHTDVSRDRNINADQRLDTLLHFHGGQTWEIALPNGVYEVTASIGDAGFTSTHTLNVEGLTFFAALPLNANAFATHTALVAVNDGRLTLDMGDAADKSTRINFLRIAVPTSQTRLLPFAAADVDLNTRLDAADVAGFVAGWGTDGSSRSLEDRVRHGDLDFDGDTDADDFAILNVRWVETGHAPLSLEALLAPEQAIVIPAGLAQGLVGPVTGTTRLIKQGPGILVLDAPNSHSGGTVVEAGTVDLRDPEGLGLGFLEVWAGATVRFDLGLAAVILPAVRIEAGGAIDLGTSRLTIAADGFDANALWQWIAAGRAEGTWRGPSGIRSAAAATAPEQLAVGYRIAADGSVTLGTTALGDVDLDGDVDAFDIVSLQGAGGYGGGLPVGWSGGDVNYDGRADILDLVAISSASRFGLGPLEPSGLAGPTTASAAAAPQPVAALSVPRLLAFRDYAAALIWLDGSDAEDEA
jgi:autotransporter-associated beta strand protein